MTKPAGAFIPVASKATKKKLKLKLGISGPSGAGKTKGALWLATNLIPGGRVLCVDTENSSALLYADEFTFDHIPLPPPFESSRYEACIDYAVQEGYDVLILDSITHQWDGEGGVLRRKEQLDIKNPKSNSFMNWAKFTPEHTHFIETIKQAPLHIIATMRSKQDYVLEKRGEKTVPVKMGLAPIVREGTDYEFSIVFDLTRDSHLASVSKDRSGLFDGREVDLKDPAIAKEIRSWLEGGAEDKPAPKPKTRASSKPKEEPAPVQSPDNIHGVDITNDDVPDNIGGKPAATETAAPIEDYNRPLKPDEKKAVIERLRGYAKVVGDDDLGKWIVSFAKVKTSKEMTCRQWMDAFHKLDEAADSNKLQQLIKQR